MQPHADRTGFLERLASRVWRGLLAARAPLQWACVLVGLCLLAGLLPVPAPDTPAWLTAWEKGLLALGRDASWWTRLGRIGLGLLGCLAAFSWLSHLLPRWQAPPPRRGWRRAVLLPWETPRAHTRLADALALSAMHPLPASQNGHLALVSSRPWPWRALSAELGLLATLLALALLWGASRQGPRIVLTADGAHALGTEPGLTAQVRQIVLIPNSYGRPHSLSVEVALQAADGSADTVTVGLRRPAWWRGLTLHLLTYGPALRVQAQDAAGAPLLLREVLGTGEAVPTLRVPFADDQQERWLALPERSLLVRLVHYPDGQAQGSLSVQIVRGRDGQVLADQFLDGAGVVTAEELTLSIVPELYVTLEARREPHRPAAWLGAALLALGALVGLLLPPRFGWARVEATDDGRSRCTLCVPARRRQIVWAECTLNILAEQAQAAPISGEESTP